MEKSCKNCEHWGKPHGYSAFAECGHLWFSVAIGLNGLTTHPPKCANESTRVRTEECFCCSYHKEVSNGKD